MTNGGQQQNNKRLDIGNCNSLARHILPSAMILSFLQFPLAAGSLSARYMWRESVVNFVCICTQPSISLYCSWTSWEKDAPLCCLALVPCMLLSQASPTFVLVCMWQSFVSTHFFLTMEENTIWCLHRIIHTVKPTRQISYKASFYISYHNFWCIYICLDTTKSSTYIRESIS
jgi:hypothetical protein